MSSRTQIRCETRRSENNVCAPRKDSKSAGQLVAGLTSNKKTRLEMDEPVMQSKCNENETLSDCLKEDNSNADASTVDSDSMALNDCNADINDPGRHVILPLDFPECYPSVSPKIFDTYGMVRYHPKMVFEDRVRLLTTGPALLCFLRLGYKVYVKRSDGNVYPCLYEINDGKTKHGLLEYGHRFSTSAICADAGVRHKRRVHCPISTSDSSANIIILTHKYKQCPTRIDAIISALDNYNEKEYASTVTFIGNGYGDFGGRLSIMGSGGSNKVQGHFAPTPKSSKNDPLITVSQGQNLSSRINKKLQEMALTNSVRAIFLNEKYYDNKTNKVCVDKQNQPTNVLRFLGYYQFYQCSYVCGDSHEDVANEFHNPPHNGWDNLTFRLHGHLRLEAKPLIPTMEEVYRIYESDSMIDYKKIVIDHDDHSSVTYNIPNIDEWKRVNHEISIQQIIEYMFTTGDINRHIDNTLSSNETKHPTKGKELSSDDSSNDESTFNTNHNSDWSESDNENDDYSESDDNSIIENKKTNHENSRGKTINTIDGTNASIPDVVNCCVFASAAGSMRFNRRNLVEVDGKICSAPLNDVSLGNLLRVKPIPMPNRILDVNLCYLRIVFKDHAVIRHSIEQNDRCKVSEIALNVLTEMLFQAVLLRYTGRTYCFEEYYHFCMDVNSKRDTKYRTLETRRIPFRDECSKFLQFVQLHMLHKKTKQLGGWISHQHDGAIANDVKTSYKTFCAFLENISTNIGSTVSRMLSIARKKTTNGRSLCITELQKLLEMAMKRSSVRHYGRVKWMAYVSVCDIEEFVLDPFGEIDETSIPEGIYSVEGHDMINRGLSVRITYQECLKQIVSYVYNSLPVSNLSVLGYEKEINAVMSMANRRPFSAVDAEHFLCKAWILTKSTFGGSRLSKRPKLSSCHTHPSPVLHRVEDKSLERIMARIEKTYLSNVALFPDEFRLPELIRLPEEEINDSLISASGAPPN
jgi:hypothetical protein